MRAFVWKVKYRSQALSFYLLRVLAFCLRSLNAGRLRRRDGRRRSLPVDVDDRGGAERKIHFFAFDLPHSDACFVAVYLAETKEAFCDGRVRAFGFFGGVPRSILYDNTWIAVARILGDGVRQRTQVFSELR